MEALVATTVSMPPWMYMILVFGLNVFRIFGLVWDTYFSLSTCYTPLSLSGGRNGHNGPL